MVLRDRALQILEEAVCKVILSALAAGIFLIAVAAVGTMEFYGVQLRIAVQSCPASAAHPDCFGIMPFHGKPSDDRLSGHPCIGSTSSQGRCSEGQKSYKVLYYAQRTVLMLNHVAIAATYQGPLLKAILRKG